MANLGDIRIGAEKADGAKRQSPEPALRDDERDDGGARPVAVAHDMKHGPIHDSCLIAQETLNPPQLPLELQEGQGIAAHPLQPVEIPLEFPNPLDAADNIDP